MKKIIVTALVAAVISSNINAAQTTPQCPYPNIVASIGLNQVDRSSIGVLVYGKNNYGTPETWDFEVGALSDNLTDQQAIAAANTDLFSMGAIGPISDDGDGTLCIYYSYMNKLIGVAATGNFSSSFVKNELYRNFHQ